MAHRAARRHHLGRPSNLGRLSRRRENGSRGRTRTYDQSINSSGRPASRGATKQSIESFLADRRARGLSPAPLRYYQFHLEVFTRQVRDVVGAEPADITLFIDSLECGQGGKAAYFRAVRALYRWLEEQEYIQRDPTRRLRCPRVPKPLRYAVPASDLPKLLDACPTLRYKLIVSLLADTGLRLSELAGLLVENINLPDSTFSIWGKGAKQRVGRYGPVTAQLVEGYVADAKPTGTLLGLSANGIALALKRLEHRTGIKCNAHAFRRTFACESVRNGLNLFYIQSLLGHSTLTMTRIYAEQVGSEDAIKAYKPVVR